MKSKQHAKIWISHHKKHKPAAASIVDVYGTNDVVRSNTSFTFEAGVLKV
jgi:hypothetical protein